jgi:membrane protein YqaA with SNARE-associated domain
MRTIGWPFGYVIVFTLIGAVAGWLVSDVPVRDVSDPPEKWIARIETAERHIVVVALAAVIGAAIGFGCDWFRLPVWKFLLLAILTALLCMFGLV